MCNQRCANCPICYNLANGLLQYSEKENALLEARINELLREKEGTNV